jgi:hypothetical protein
MFKWSKSSGVSSPLSARNLKAAFGSRISARDGSKGGTAAGLERDMRAIQESMDFGLKKTLKFGQKSRLDGPRREV